MLSRAFIVSAITSTLPDDAPTKRPRSRPAVAPAAQLSMPTKSTVRSTDWAETTWTTWTPRSIRRLIASRTCGRLGRHDRDAVHGVARLVGDDARDLVRVLVERAQVANHESSRP